MTTPTSPPPISEPDPSALVCSGSDVGSCAGCQRKTHRFGNGGFPLCQWCAEPVMAAWSSNVRHTNTRK
ncbi:hypothetical protein [Streptomyces sp. NPDC057280]|uniref:hypothetical protein n=1 Tax=Streptomyces sp. NPDC057280 TaxID=3346081 RepID=UPI00362BF9DA